MYHNENQSSYAINLCINQGLLYHSCGITVESQCPQFHSLEKTLALHVTNPSMYPQCLDMTLILLTYYSGNSHWHGVVHQKLHQIAQHPKLSLERPVI